MVQNLREEAAMDVDEDEDATQRPKKVADYGIEVDFDSIEDDEREQDASEALARYDKDIANTNGEIERMAPNMKAMERFVLEPKYGHEGCLRILSGWTMLRTSSLLQRERPRKHGKTLKRLVIAITK